MNRMLMLLLAMSPIALMGGALGSVHPEQPAAAPALSADLLRGLELRGIGPATKPGRVGDIAIDPRDSKVWYVAVASGGLWKTTDAGTTWKAIFDDHGSYTLGCVTLDPKNPDVVWLGTGENQSQRSVGYGDGVYKSMDAGRTWKHMGLAKSEHIAKFIIDPRNSDVVYVASQGPLWAPGGDRGLFKTTDGGKTWKAVLQISENTGITDIVMDPRNPDVIIAAAYQRRRNVGVLIGGGPEAGIFKSVDGGANWTKLTKGIPTVDLGRIALGISPQQPDIVYALIVAAGKESGFFRSPDGGESWVKQGTYKVVDPQYYGEIYPDPHKFDRVYAVDVNIHVTEDGGKKFSPTGWKMHSDNHAIVFNPVDPKHLLVGNDGGLYESNNGGSSWKHFNNMPTMQFYRVAVDNALPFYNIYGGSQDNGTVGGPSRTAKAGGIRNSDWGSYGGGDGFQPRVDPENPNIIYSMSQNGALSRMDKGAGMGKSTGIRPKTGGVRWNWDSPFIISPHSAKRLYFGGSRLFRSEDRGDNWIGISPDLTRQLDPAKQLVMGKLWGADAVSRNLFTTALGVGSALAESPAKAGMLYFGSDDGLVQVTEDGGKNWRKVDSFPGVPDMTYVSSLCASKHDAGTVYAAFNNWQRGDFKPYLLKSTDLGKTWTSIASNLPDRHVVWCIVEDHVNKDLLFVGTEFGLFCTVDGGKNWVQLKGGLPVVAFRDLEIQRRENDLVCATFGRGFYVFDDYTPLRHLNNDALAKEGVLFPVRKGYRFEEEVRPAAPAGTYVAANPPAGAMFTYYLRQDLSADKKVELEIRASGKAIGAVIEGPTTAGFHRLSWNLKTVSVLGGKQDPALAAPGQYSVTLVGVNRTSGQGGKDMTSPQSFEIIAMPK